MRLWACWLLALVTVGCGPFQVRRGPDSCSVAERWDDPFGAGARGARFSFRRGLAEVGIIAQDGRTTALHTRWTVDGDVEGHVARGAIIEVALSGEVLEIPVGEEASPVTDVSERGRHARILTTWTVLGAVTDEALERLTNVRVEALRLRLPIGQRTMPLPPHIGSRLQTLAICLHGGYPIR